MINLFRSHFGSIIHNPIIELLSIQNPITELLSISITFPTQDGEMASEDTSEDTSALRERSSAVVVPTSIDFDFFRRAVVSSTDFDFFKRAVVASIDFEFFKRAVVATSSCATSTTAAASTSLWPQEYASATKEASR